MTVEELIELLNKVQTKDAVVYVNTTSYGSKIDGVVVQHDMEDDEVSVILKVD